MKKIFFSLFLVFFLALGFQIYQASAFSFAVIGDTQEFKAGRKSGLKKAAGIISQNNPDLVFAMGDLVGTKLKSKKLAGWKSTLGSLTQILYPVLGNHDSGVSIWRNSFALPANGPTGFSELTYSFDRENSHFVVLASSFPAWHKVNETQRAWLEQDLAANTKENIFVFFHEPAFPVGHKIGKSLDADSGSRNALWEILDNYNVTAVFSGHEHIYSRKKIDSSVFSGAENSIYQFIVGNTDSYSHSKPVRSVAFYYRPKSFLIVGVNGDQITTKLYALNGKLVENFGFSK